MLHCGHDICMYPLSRVPRVDAVGGVQRYEDGRPKAAVKRNCTAEAEFLADVCGGVDLFFGKKRVLLLLVEYGKTEGLKRGVGDDGLDR